MEARWFPHCSLFCWPATEAQCNPAQPSSGVQVDSSQEASWSPPGTKQSAAHVKKDIICTVNVVQRSQKLTNLQIFIQTYITGQCIYSGQQYYIPVSGKIMWTSEINSEKESKNRMVWFIYSPEIYHSLIFTTCLEEVYHGTNKGIFENTRTLSTLMGLEQVTKTSLKSLDSWNGGRHPVLEGWPTQIAPKAICNMLCTTVYNQLKASLILTNVHENIRRTLSNNSMHYRIAVIKPLRSSLN